MIKSSTVSHMTKNALIDSGITGIKPLPMVYSSIFVTQITKQHDCSNWKDKNIKDHKL